MRNIQTSSLQSKANNIFIYQSAWESVWHMWHGVCLNPIVYTRHGNEVKVIAFRELLYGRIAYDQHFIYAHRKLWPNKIITILVCVANIQDFCLQTDRRSMEIGIFFITRSLEFSIVTRFQLKDFANSLSNKFRRSQKTITMFDGLQRLPKVPLINYNW